MLWRHQGKDVIFCVAGTHAVALDLSTGQPIAAPYDLGFAPIRPPQTADLNGDGDNELVLVERVGESTFETYLHPSIERIPPQQRLWAFTCKSEFQRLWDPVEQAADFEKHVRIYQPPPAWPLVADLNDDGSAEIIGPDGTSTPFREPQPSDRKARTWGELQMLDGMTGRERWRRRLQTIDQQVDQLIVGPDIDGDGWRDILAAALFGRDVQVRLPQVFVDAISGQDGRPLWHSGRTVPDNRALDEVFIDTLQWWGAGADGWPQLVVSVRQGSSLGEPLVLACFSAGSGRITHESTTLNPPVIADGDGDGVDDLFSFDPSQHAATDLGGKLLSFRGTSPPSWRRLDGQWQAGRDYDGDGFDDLLAKTVQVAEGKLSIVAASGRTGRELYRTPVGSLIWGGAIIRPLDVDLDGDGVCDLLTTDQPRGGDEVTPPILAFSGATGRELWQPTLEAGTTQQTLCVQVVDLESDGHWELIYVAELSFPGADGSPPSFVNHPTWLVVLDGGTGRLRWKQQISQGERLAGDMVYWPDLIVAAADLNGDGVKDIVTPAFLLGHQTELRAYNGQAGQLLWQRETSQIQESLKGASSH